MDQFQESDHADYTRRFIRYRFRPSNWGLVYDFYLGYNMFTGDLSGHFANRAAIGFAFEILYKEITASVRFNYSGTETRRSITHREITWPQGVKGYAVGADLAFQYPVLQNKKIKLSPFGGFVRPMIREL